MPDLRPILRYLTDLRRHNEKAWFDANRARFDEARAEFAAFLDGVIDELRGTDGLGDLEGRRCIARIYRDVRFSKDKSPYKTNFAAMIAPGGWGSEKRGYYVSIAPRGESIVAGGMYMPAPRQLAAFRDAIVDNAAPFKRIIRHKGFVAMFGEIEGERLKTAPRGYDRDHPALDLLRLTQVYAAREFTDAEVVKPGFRKQVVAACNALRPLTQYLASVVA